MSLQPRKYRLIVSVAIDGLDVDDWQQYVDEFDAESIMDCLEEEIRTDVTLTLVTLPGDKCLSSDFTVTAHTGRIVGARLEEIER